MKMSHCLRKSYVTLAPVDLLGTPCYHMMSCSFKTCPQRIVNDDWCMQLSETLHYLKSKKK